MQVEAEEEAAQLAETMKASVSVPDIPIVKLPPAIVVHGGGFFV